MSPIPSLAQEPNTPLNSLDNDNPTSSARVLRRFRVVFNAVRAHFQDIEKQVGLGGAQVWALNVIRDQPGLGVGALAKSMDIHQSTASNLVKVLQRKELISMRKASTDRRQVELQILPAGLAILSQVPGPFEGILPGALNQLSTATLLRLDQDLSELIALLKADERAAGIPLAHL